METKIKEATNSAKNADIDLILNGGVHTTICQNECHNDDGKRAISYAQQNESIPV